MLRVAAMTSTMLGPLLSLLGSVIGALAAGYVVSRSASLALERSLMEQCYASFLRFSALIASVTEEHAPAAGGEAWTEAYRAKRQAMEPVADELIALTRLLLDDHIADKVAETRLAFRRWGAFDLTSKLPGLTGEQRVAEHEKLISGQPLLILRLLSELSELYRAELRRVFSWRRWTISSATPRP